jgi:hypothetical protein
MNDTISYLLLILLFVVVMISYILIGIRHDIQDYSDWEKDEAERYHNKHD